MYFTFKVTDTDKVIIQELLKVFQKVVNDAVTNSITSIKTQVGELIKVLIKATPEFDSIMNGQLKLDLGLAHPQTALAQILDKLADSVQINFKPLKIKNEDLIGNLEIDIISGSFSNILDLSESTYYSKGYRIPWLEWLLLKGDAIIIANYSVKYFTRTVGASNTGSALMIHNNKHKTGWRVPSQFSGTKDNNFITRAFINNPQTEKTIGDILETEITSRIR